MTTALTPKTPLILYFSERNFQDPGKAQKAYNHPNFLSDFLHPGSILQFRRFWQRRRGVLCRTHPVLHRVLGASWNPVHTVRGRIRRQSVSFFVIHASHISGIDSSTSKYCFDPETIHLSCLLDSTTAKKLQDPENIVSVAFYLFNFQFRSPFNIYLPYRRRHAPENNKPPFMSSSFDNVGSILFQNIIF